MGYTHRRIPALTLMMLMERRSDEISVIPIVMLDEIDNIGIKIITVRQFLSASKMTF